MIRSPRRHEGPPKRPEQTTLSSTSLALGAEKEDMRLDITCLISGGTKPRVSVYFQGTRVSKKNP